MTLSKCLREFAVIFSIAVGAGAILISYETVPGHQAFIGANIKNVLLKFMHYLSVWLILREQHNVSFLFFFFFFILTFAFLPYERIYVFFNIK